MALRAKRAHEVPRTKYQESATFTIVGGGIILSLGLAYVYELSKQEALSVIAGAEFQTGSVLDFLYMIGYLFIAVGLLLHRKYQEWSFRAVDRLLG